MVSLNTVSLRRGLQTDPWIFVAFPAKGGLPWLILGTHLDTHTQHTEAPSPGSAFRKNSTEHGLVLKRLSPLPDTEVKCEGLCGEVCWKCRGRGRRLPMLDPVRAIPVGKPRTESDPKQREFSPGTARAAALQGSWSPLQGQGQVTERPGKPCAESSRSFPPSPQFCEAAPLRGSSLKRGGFPASHQGGGGGISVGGRSARSLFVMPQSLHQQPHTPRPVL